jgi:hypothetical protein
VVVLPGIAQADDTAFIQAVIRDNAGGTARLPPGRYVVSGLRVPARTRVTGASLLATTLSLRPDPPAGGVTTPILFIEGSGVTIDRLTFDGDLARQEPEGSYANSWTGRSDSAAIRIDPGIPGKSEPFLEDILIANCRFQNTRGAAIATKRRLVGLTVRDNHFHALNFEAVFLDQEGTRRSSNITITDNEVVNTRDIRTRQVPPPGTFFGGLGFPVNQVSGLRFQGNRGRNIPKNLISSPSSRNGCRSTRRAAPTRCWAKAECSARSCCCRTARSDELVRNTLADYSRGTPATSRRCSQRRLEAAPKSANALVRCIVTRALTLRPIS